VVAHRLLSASRVNIPRQLGAGIGHIVFRCRDWGAPLLLVTLVAATRPHDFLAAPSVERWLSGAGCLAVALGLLIRCLAIGSSGVRRAGIAGRVDAASLCEDGAYAWCRNPLYLGNAVILAGLALVFDSRWLVLVGLPLACLAIASLVAAEESVLAERFGARYAAYRDRVSRFLPRRPLLAAGEPLNWRRALRREHGTMFAATSAILALLAVKALARGGLAAWHRHGWSLLAVWLVAAALWAVVRRLKRSARLGDLPGAIPPDLDAASSFDHVAA
jgi:protein-S-isoprenylcysteine O-methyltransferase Ste14